MLNGVRRNTLRALTATGIVIALSSPAAAEGPGSGTVTPCSVRDICIIVTEPGGGGGTQPGGGTPTGGATDNGVPVCTWNGVQRPCWDPKLGWFSENNGCYYKPAKPQPPATDPVWGGSTPQDGQVYDVVCRDKDGNLSVWPQQFFPQPPVPMPVYDNVVDLARQAIGALESTAPVVHTAPAGKAVVGVPVWLWYERTPLTAGPLSKTVKGNVISVTATAVLDHVEWTTGPGEPVVTCKTTGTPYEPGSGKVTSPDCQHIYRTSSAGQPNGTYEVTATAVWKVKAVRNDTGQVILSDTDWPVPSDTVLPIEVAEVQLLN
ncbi:hypothetical protein ACIRBX_16145 [Kitasatospora sp. NPDC096147]|uniref:hypothetical protein n=1 Tax=Kitasatospora sp. NPDC096147 TaxID=3364093 RepID=UPI003806B4C5